MVTAGAMEAGNETGRHDGCENTVKNIPPEYMESSKIAAVRLVSPSGQWFAWD